MIEQYIHPCTITRAAATMAKQNAHPWRRPFPRDDESPECTDPWRGEYPREEECAGIPRRKGQYPRGTMRTQQWQERWQNRRSPINPEEANEGILNPSSKEATAKDSEGPCLLIRECVPYATRKMDHLYDRTYTINPRIDYRRGPNIGCWP